MSYKLLPKNIGFIPRNEFEMLVANKTIIKKGKKYYIKTNSKEYIKLLLKSTGIIQSSANHFKNKKERDEFIDSVDKELYDIKINDKSVYLELKRKWLE